MMASTGGGHGGPLERPAKKHRFEPLLLLEDVLDIPDIVHGVVGFVERKELRGVALVCKSWKKAAADRIRAEGPTILVTGENRSNNSIRQQIRYTWIFMPSSKTWRWTSPLPLGYAEEAAKLHGFVYVVSTSFKLVRYDFLDEVWTDVLTQQMTPECCEVESVACLNDKLYVVCREGEYMQRQQPLPPCLRVKNLSIYSVDPISLNLTLCNRMPPMARTYYKMQATGDYIYFVGGIHPTVESWRPALAAPNRAESTVERWRPGMNEMEAVASMHTGRIWHSLVEANGHLFVLGGMSSNCSGRIIKTCEKYCPKSNNWKVVTSMPSFRCGFSVVAVKELIYVMGGKVFKTEDISSRALYLQQGVESVDVYNTETGEWSQGPSMPKECFDLTSV